MTTSRFALALTFCVCAAFAQQDVGSIAGTVTDSSGAAVPNATVSITNSDTNVLARKLTTSGEGAYVAPVLPVAHYSIKVEAPSFKAAVRENIVLHVSDALTMNFKLEVGDVTQTITVESSPLQVELQNGATQATTINGTQIRELALVTRNYEQLVALMPGVTSASVDQLYVGTSLPSGQTATIPYSINGARNSASAWLVDGVDNVDRGSNATLLTTPSIDAISEFKVERSGYSAQLGRAAGGQIEVVTKSGTSAFHGDAFEFVRNSAFAANNFYNNATKVNVGPDGKAQVAPLHYNNFGWTLGGPLYIPNHYNTDKNKTFFFVSQEFRRVITYANGTATLPTQSELTGAFPGAVCTSYTGSTCNSTAATIPQSLVNPVAKQYIQDIFSKLPLSPSSNTLVSLFRNVYNFEQELYKIDQNFGPKLQLSARYLRDQIPTVEPQGLFLGTPVPGVGITSTNAPGRTWNVHATSTFSPTWVNEAGYSFSYGALVSDPTGLINSKFSPDIKSTLPFAVTLGQVPNLGFTGGTSIAGFGPYRDYNRNHQIFDNATKVWGSHTIHFGGVYYHYQKTENAAGGNQGTFAFSGASVPSTTTAYLQSFANFLQGNVTTFTQASQDITPDIRSNQFEAYVQDDWRIRPNFTLNIGLRYSLFLQPVDVKNELTNFDPGTYSASNAPTLTAGGLLTTPAQNYLNGIIVNGTNSPWGNKISNQDYTDFAPRFGFAWDPYGDGKTSVRGGYGIFYDATLYGTFEQNIFANPPFVNSVSISNVTLDNPAAGTAAVSFTPKSLHGTATNFTTPYTQQWSLEVQRELRPGWLASAGYVGSKGTNLLGIVDINQLPPNFAYTSGLVPTTTNFTTSGSELVLNQLRPYKGYNAINVIEPWFNSNYNSLQLYTQKRFKGDNQISASYTWSKSLTDNGTDRSSAPQSTYNFNQGEYGPGPYDRTQVLNINFVYELPFFKTQQGLVGKALGGWEVSGIGTYYTGLPYTVTTSSSDPAALGLLGASASSARPDLLCNPYAGWSSTRTSWFNKACFANPAAGQHHVGNAGRGVLRGPGYQGWSFSASKNVTFGQEGRFRFQLRGEASNALNQTNPSIFGSTNNTSSLFGQITGYRDPRIIQLGAKFYF
ncbi:MAG: TonB-dependent receptor [Acidobacteriota bacterium]|nr:TonB-dependent receptor [Acidobacteriota bacterium]